MEKLMESLSPMERKILPFLEERNISDICKKSNLDKISVLRALEYLQNKNLVKLNVKKKRIINVGINGALYRKKGLPERRLLLLLSQKRIIGLNEAQKESKLSPNEFKVSIGTLKQKALIELKNGKLILNAPNEEISKKSLEEIFIDSLPLEENSLKVEEKLALKNLQKRRGIVQVDEKRITTIKILPVGKKIMNSKELGKELIEQITPEILKNEKNWKGKKFRRYDVTAPVPKIYGGKRHFVNSSIDGARKIWTEMGFEEMSGDYIQTSFWNFDALFTAQDHPVREMQDTFFINKKGKLPEKKIIEAVKKSHEKGVEGSKGWKYKWNEELTKKMCLRTHTTCVSAQTLAKLKKEDLPKKYFSIGKCFRNETIDWSHGFEFNQSEGIVVDRNGNFRHLIGYLKQFFSKMGFEDIRIRPAYFPYTEPSLEIDAWHPEKKIWLELGGAGIFRPEVSVALFGENIPVLAWGPGFDRILMDYYKIKDLRELYKNDIDQLRKMKSWIGV
ncbi:MAG: phenylalanine--tRNA ligase subunit alpha [Nanoarchaeota archaeon]|nr:phenylalanine--tRNA ligase subunit alpha [Nanoarchaeota archaeon]